MTLYFDEIQLLSDKTTLYTAVENENIEIVKLFLANYKLNPNIITILILNTL